MPAVVYPNYRIGSDLEACSPRKILKFATFATVSKLVASEITHACSYCILSLYGRILGCHPPHVY